MVEAAGVIFFRDRKTACQFGMVTHRNDKGCKIGAQVEVSGKLIKNKFLPDTYDIDRGSKPAGETLSCKCRVASCAFRDGVHHSFMKALRSGVGIDVSR